MRKLAMLVVGLLVFGLPMAAFGAGKMGALDVNAPAAAKVKADIILHFKSMEPVAGTLVGADIHGITGAGADWLLKSAKGKLGAAGDLRINVKGLVLASSLENPLLSFSAVVSCVDSGGSVVNVSTTGDFPTDINGNARIKETLTIPSPCLAPVVFVTNDSGNWLAVTGGSVEVEAPEPAPEPEAP